jgi:DNA-binding NtrC family response regulator
MEISVVALSSDQELVTATRDFDSTDVRFVIVDDPNEAFSLLEHSPVPSLFVDTRSEFFVPAAEQVVLKLANGDLPAVNIVTAGDSFYPSSVAAEFDILDSTHLDSCSVPPHTLLASVANHVTQTFATPTPKTRHVESRTVAISTYTPEFFGVIDDLLRVAAREVTLLLIGETGTGKTTLARFIHELSSRRDRQFQDLACGALPSDLIESELFGHIRGAFTGADRNKIGRFEAAGRGTMLLDEIDVLDLKQQTKLLKIIETGDFEMVGSTETRRSEARLIVASNVNLQELVDHNKFRSDLYYRLNVLEFRLPALRDRQKDIPHLAMQFVRELCAEHSITITRVDTAFLAALKKYSWPGNLRELKNHVRRAVLFSHDGLLTINELSHKVVRCQFADDPAHLSNPEAWKLADRVAQSERGMLEDALRANNNNRTKTARALGISRVGLYKKMRRLGLAKDPVKSS